MNEQEQAAILAVSLMAAFADGAKHDAERAQIKSIVDSNSSASSTNLAALYQEVLLKKRTLAETVAPLQSAETRQLAYEMAVCVCDADGARNASEREFLEELRRLLCLDAAASGEFAERADAIASIPLERQAEGPVVATVPSRADLDATILHYSILNAALELLPQSLATMAIIPLQMKMVYAIGKAHGFELDRGHVKDLLTTLGVGLTSQYVEEIGRKLIGGLLRKLGGGIAGALGRQAASSAMAFATTYALGHVAKQYYAGGRTLSQQSLKSAFQSIFGEAQALRARYAGEIEQKAKTIDVEQLLRLVRQQ